MSEPQEERVELREVRPGDVDAFFEHQSDPAANAMAAFPARDRESHQAHWAKIMRDPEVITRAVLVSGAVVGNFGSWTQDGHREVGYWIAREHWGKGVATRALRQFLEVERTRPLYAWVAKGNVGSARVVEKCGFVRIDPPDNSETHFVFELRD